MGVKKQIAVLPGDGIGPDVINQAVRVLDTISKKYQHDFSFQFALVGADAIDKTGDPLPKATLDLCKSSDAVLFGAVGHPKYDQDPNSKVRPEQGLLKMRKELGLFANIRPVTTYSALHHLSPVKSNLLEHVDIEIFRELTGGIYFGKKETSADGKTATDTCIYHVDEIVRIAHLAFKRAQERKRKLTLVDKANVMETSRLWRKTINEIAKDYPDVEVFQMFVDNAAMQLIINPSQFDVILTENMFGDILSDEASVLAGTLGLLPSASIGTGTAVFEPIHGSYPQAAGKDIANPSAAILSAAMMLDHFGLHQEAIDIRNAIDWIICNGFFTKDIDPINFYFTSTIGELVCDFVTNRVEDAIHKANIQLRKSTII
ncbi:MAG: 3-isopropylmalate dehydrogenase [Bacteroidota bacterium]